MSLDNSKLVEPLTSNHTQHDMSEQFGCWALNATAADQQYRGKFFVHNLLPVLKYYLLLHAIVAWRSK